MTDEEPVSEPSVAQDGTTAAAQQDDGGHEFSQLHNLTIEACGKRGKLWGALALVGGGITLIGTLVAWVMLSGMFKWIALAAGLPSAVVHLATAKRYMTAGDSLLGIVKTQGNDVQHLMKALAELRLAFKFEAVVLLGTAVLAMAIMQIATMNG